ncbi:hypothetical protein [Bradyrhizobium sp. JYMT SZCCT0428]|uniref:hypothetical protein n=1 Tax=Bradyrhizobium sp. JYMT SZCCT0428 TaxID=2807673 RepID=UPI001BA6C60A|nr:hypothetical protein [Bradyrhizobium sp. JYMT SZCCT0428]MBR1154281.1 hypothetical protein [Bradyrhizobium sp. JYMT SZCCT0428]
MKSHPIRDEAVNEMTRALGTALMHWQQIEFKLFLLYRTLCGGRHPQSKITDTIYGAMSLETKMVAVAALIKLRVSDKKYMQSWDTVAKAFFKQKKLRDKMAHWSIVGTPDQKRSGYYYAFLAPPLSDLDRMLKTAANPGNSEAISAETLLRRSLDDFSIVTAAIDQFRDSLPALAE